MAQLSESLVREAIRRIRGRHMHHLTINEVEQALWAWLMLNGFESRPTQETSPEQQIPDGWCPICGGKDGEHKSGCQDGSEIL